jgi:beta-carotene hydroxylase
METTAVVLGHGAAAALAVAMYGPIRGALTYALALGVPVIFSSWSMMFTNYVQHVGCDPRSPDNHSRNFVSPIMNWLVFQAGYHTVHHEHATTHWSRYPALHAERAIGIDPSLNERTILGYCLKRYLLGRESLVADRDGLPT